MFLAESTVES